VVHADLVTRPSAIEALIAVGVTHCLLAPAIHACIACSRDADPFASEQVLSQCALRVAIPR
jgi:hypothetical protein